MNDLDTDRQLVALDIAAHGAEQYRLMQAEADADRAETRIQERIRDELRDPSDECIDWLLDCYSHDYGKLARIMLHAAYAQGDCSRQRLLSAAMAMLAPQVESFVRSAQRPA